jgi:WhiB family redox-sensing transcriptional regulator
MLGAVSRPTTVVLGDWVAQAACRDDDTAIYFPDRGDASALAVARERCAGCPVQRECLEYALGFPAGELLGVWGGLSQRERRQLRRMGVTSVA